MDAKSILMGIGMGIIFTSIIGVIYTKGDLNNNQIAREKNYGVVKNEEYVISNKVEVKQENKQNIDKKNAKNKKNKKNKKIIEKDTRENNEKN